jgi:hypothetical protein
MPKVFNRGAAQSTELFCEPYRNSKVKKNKHYIVLDVQVQQLISQIGGLKKIDQLSISLVAVYDSKKDAALVFKPDQLDSLFELCYKRLVVGFGIKRLDLIVLVNAGLDLKKCKFFDMQSYLDSLLWGPLIGLNSVFNGTLDKQLEFQPVDLFVAEELEKLEKLAIEHVNMINDVFAFGQKNQFITIKDKTGEDSSQVPVNWDSLLSK